MTELVNPVPVSEAPSWVKAFVTTLVQDPFAPDFGQWIDRWTRRWDAERTWGARDGGRWVATLATDQRAVSVPGSGSLPTDALTAVTVAATHRRRGLLTRMIGQSLAVAKERGDVLGGLIAAEYPIYGRFGYAPATRSATLVQRPRERGALVTPVAGGTVRQVEAAELLPLAHDLFERSRAQRAGQIDRPRWWWERMLAPDAPAQYHWLLHEGAEGPDGFLGWRPARTFGLERYAAVEVESFVATSDHAYRNLWAYLTSLDVVEELTLHNRPLDEAAQFLLTDGRTLQQTHTTDQLWLKLLDVPAAFAQRSYATDGALVFEVVDDSPGGFAAGRFALEAADGAAGCEATGRTPDLTLSARALAAVYLGGHTLANVRHAGEVEEHRAGALQRFDAMLSVPLAPWCQTHF